MQNLCLNFLFVCYNNILWIQLAILFFSEEFFGTIVKVMKDEDVVSQVLDEYKSMLKSIPPVSPLATTTYLI